MNTTYHKKEVTIAGEMITAEYFDVHFTEPCIDHKYSISDLWDTITYPFYVIKCWYRLTRTKIRYGLQRMKNDYDNTDTFGLCDKFIERYSKILKEYQKNLHGHPGTMTEEEWNNIIETLLFHLYYMDEEHINEELCKDVPESWIPTWNTSGEIMEKHKNEFFRLFSEHFYDLWD